MFNSRAHRVLPSQHRHFPQPCSPPCFSVFFLFLFVCLFPPPHPPLTENNRPPLQRSRSRQNVNAGSEAAKAARTNEAQSEPEARQSAAPSKVAPCSEAGRRYRNPLAGHTSWQERERVIERGLVKAAERERERETEVGAEPPAFQPTSAGAAVSSCSANGESDVEALLARLRAL